MYRQLLVIYTAFALLLAASSASAQDSSRRAAAEAQVKLAVERMTRDKDLDAAVPGFRKAVELDSTYPMPHFYLGTIAYKQAKWQEAIGHFEAFSKLDATSDYFVQAQLRIEESKKAIEREKSRPAATTLADPAKFAEQFALAKQAESEGLRAKAARLYGQAYCFAPTRVNVGIKAAKMLIEFEEPLQAARVLVPLIQELERRSGDDDKALAAEALALHRQVASTIDAEHRRLIAVARASAAAGKADDALVAVNQARALFPDRQDDDLLAAGIHLKVSRVDQALVEIKRAAASGRLEPAYISWQLATVAGENTVRGALAEKALSEYFTDAFGAKGLQKAIAGISGQSNITNSIGMRLVRIPAGTFEMGSPRGETGREDGEVQHRVTLSKGFYMGATEVTQKQWEAVMGNNPSYFKGDDLPVEQVSWDDAVSFCRKLSQKEGKTYRLPTEAEWEYACRAGMTTAYHEGDKEDDLAVAGWYGNDKGNSDKKTHAVGQKKANAWGLYDMHGNVYEWCSDWQGDYPGGAATDPTGPAHGTFRVLRGGGWLGSTVNCRSASRSWDTPAQLNCAIGFRVALSSPD